MMDKNLLPPEERPLAEQLESLAQRMTPNAYFERELEKRLMNSQSPEPKAKGFFAQALPTLGWAVGLILLTLALTWVIRSMAPQPAAFDTPMPSQEAPLQNETILTPKPAGEVYDWNGTPLYLQAILPETPTETSLYQASPSQHATLESARALAARFGMAGQIYLTPPEVSGTADNDFLVIDGNQRLQIRSDHYYVYYPDYAPPTGALPVAIPNAETIIRDFLASNKFDFEYRIEASDVPGTYIVLPFTPDGINIRHEYFDSFNLTFQFDAQGHFAVISNTLPYAPVSEQKYPIITAREALQKLLDPSANAGILMGQTSAYQSVLSWTRPRRENETITLWGWMSSFASAEGGTPHVSLDGYNAIGNVSDVPASTINTYVEVTGQFQTVNGIKVFNVESWKTYDGYEDGIFGILQREGDQFVIVTDAATFVLPDVPADVPIPMENAYATGISRLSDGVSPNIFEWKTLDNRGGFGGGGGGGGGLGFYKLNLSGTPVPFPTAGPALGGGGGGGVSDEGYPYTVVAGDTCQSIAGAFIVDVETLITANNLPADCSTLAVGQTILIPPQEAMPPEDVNQRGILSITIFESPNGDQRPSYGFLTMGPSDEFDTFYYYILEGDGLETLQQYNGRPVDVWGKLGMSNEGIVKIDVERFEIPFPDLQYQIMKGEEKSLEINGQNVLLFTDEDGNNYVELAPNCYDIIGEESVSGTGRVGQALLLEALAVPGLTFGGYPAICVSSSYPAVNPKTNEPMEVTITADQPSILPEQPSAEAGNLPTLTIEKVELVYYVLNQRYPMYLPGGPVYIQPVWRFYGHYSDGSPFEALIQALNPLFLLPETEAMTDPG